MKQVYVAAVLCLIGMVAGIGNARTYTEDVSKFSNPERGWFQNFIPDYTTERNYRVPNAADFAKLKSDGYSVFKHQWHLPRNAALTQVFLDSLDREANGARANGFKFIWRFSYCYNLNINDSDATLNRITGHLDQIKPLLQKHRDVLVVFEAGLVGWWGEWHHSRNGHVCNWTSARFNDNSRAIFNKILEVVPVNRMSGVRYPKTKMLRISDCTDGEGGLGFSTPLNESTAYKNTPQSRLGYWNQSFATSEFGSYVENSAQETYTVDDTRFLPQWGEPASGGAASSTGAQMIAEARKFHYSMINATQPDAASTMPGWKSDGSYDTAAAKLGYRFCLTSATASASVKPGSACTLSLAIRNDGFARPFNPRLARLVLRKQGQTGISTAYMAAANPAGVDTRLWLPGSAEVKNLVCVAGIPAAMTTGSWDLLLWLPDPESTLTMRSEYAIRLANTGVWEGATGLNNLGLTVQVDPAATGAAYAGDNLFVPIGDSPTVVAPVYRSMNRNRGGVSREYRVNLRGQRVQEALVGRAHTGTGGVFFHVCGQWVQSVKVR